jgi:hypothetical protein
MLVLICNTLLNYKLPSVHCAVRAAEEQAALHLLPRIGKIKHAI